MIIDYNNNKNSVVFPIKKFDKLDKAAKHKFKKIKTAEKKFLELVEGITISSSNENDAKEEVLSYLCSESKNVANISFINKWYEISTK